MTPPPDPDVARIARGGTPEWSGTYEHAVHGSLTFRAKLPLASDILAHSIAVDERLAGMPDPSIARVQTLILAAALAGLTPANPQTPGKGILVELPVVDERREPPTPDDPDREVVTKVYYDAAGETSITFLVELWDDFSTWRRDKLGVVDAVKGSSGETVGSDSSESSIGPIASPSTTPVS